MRSTSDFADVTQLQNICRTIKDLDDEASALRTEVGFFLREKHDALSPRAYKRLLQQVNLPQSEASALVAYVECL